MAQSFAQSLDQRVKQLHNDRLKELVKLGFYKNMQQARRHWENLKHT